MRLLFAVAFDVFLLSFSLVKGLLIQQPRCKNGVFATFNIELESFVT